MLSSKQKELQAIIQPVVEGFGFEYVGCEMIGQGKHSLLRVYVDKQDADGVHIDNCAAISRQLSATLDVEDIIKGQYQLEVSSPGLERPLFTSAHFQRFVGNKIKVRLTAPIENQKQFVGFLKAVEDDGILLHSNEKDFRIPWGAIFKANVVYEV